MDSLGGILIKGLLGNPILAQFRLFIDILIEEVTPTPTPSSTETPTVTPTPSSTDYPTPTPTPTPTVTPLPVDWTGGHGGAGGGREPEPENRTVKITLRYKSKERVSYHKTNDRIVRVMINIIGLLNKARSVFQKVTVRLSQTKSEVTKIKVKTK